MNNVSPAKITIDELAVMINAGFIGLEEKLTNRIDQLEKKVDLIHSSLSNQIDNIYLNYTQRVEHVALANRVKRIERKVGIQHQP